MSGRKWTILISVHIDIHTHTHIYITVYLYYVLLSISQGGHIRTWIKIWTHILAGFWASRKSVVNSPIYLLASLLLPSCHTPYCPCHLLKLQSCSGTTFLHYFPPTIFPLPSPAPTILISGTRRWEGSQGKERPWVVFSSLPTVTTS